MYFFFSSRRRHTRLQGDWSSDVCSSDLRFVEAELSALLQAAGGTLPVIKKDARGAFVMETTHAPSEKPAAKASAPATTQAAATPAAPAAAPAAPKPAASKAGTKPDRTLNT